MNIDRINPEAIREAFKFLVKDFGYSVIVDKELFHDDRRYGFRLEYLGKDRRVILSHDYKENFFYFSTIRGIKTKYPNDHDRENIVSFWRLFRGFEPTLELKKIQPEDQTCAEAALINAQLLRKYASEILRGEKWI